MYMHINFFFIFAQNLGSNLSARSSRLVKSRYTTLIHHVSSLTTTPLRDQQYINPKWDNRTGIYKRYILSLHAIVLHNLL